MLWGVGNSHGETEPLRLMAESREGLMSGDHQDHPVIHIVRDEGIQMWVHIHAEHDALIVECVTPAPVFLLLGVRGAIPYRALAFLLALCPGIIPGGTWGTTCFAKFMSVSFFLKC